MKNKRVVIYDIEVIGNFFCYVDVDKDTEEMNTFIIWDSCPDIIDDITLKSVVEINQLNEFLEYLRSGIAQVGYNNLSYDSQVLQYLLNISKTKDQFGSAFTNKSTRFILDEIYSASQNAINSEYPAYPEWKLSNPQLDLYKIFHFDNKAKRTGLKDLQFAMGWQNVENMPYHHDSFIDSIEQVHKVVEYCKNDVMSTYEFYKRALPQIRLRQELSSEFGLNLYNANDPKIGSEIFADAISKDIDIDKRQLKQMRTYRTEIQIDEIILPNISFQTKEFNSILNKFKSATLTKSDISDKINTKDVLNYSLIYKGMKYDYGLGGIHGFGQSGVYEQTEQVKIISCDITSMYPNIAINYNFYPEHLGLTFCHVYKSVFDKRAKAKKEKNKTIDAGLKLALNGAYGKSNDENSFFYDPKFTMSITINGQLLISMLIEELLQNSFEIIMVNTDGFETFVPNDREELYYQICKKWEEESKLQLEYAEYSKMVLRDVNNYLALYTDGKIKYKGAFEIDKEWHKDSSFKIVRKAVSNYFTKGIPVSDTINDSRDIFDFCGRQKFMADSYGEVRTWELDKSRNPVLVRKTQQKTVRYYLSTKGLTFYKMYKKGNSEIINKGFKAQIFNKFEEKDWNDYHINYSFYTIEANKIIRAVESGQTFLFED